MVVLAEQRRSSSQPLFYSFEKPAAPPPAAGFFVSAHHVAPSRKTFQMLPCATRLSSGMIGVVRAIFRSQRAPSAMPLFF
jgi:hypothetical protein